MTDARILTRARLAEFAAATEKATEGPWLASQNLARLAAGLLRHWMIQSNQQPERGFILGNDFTEENAAFIALSRAAVPELLAHIEALEEKISRQRDDWVRDTRGRVDE